SPWTARSCASSSSIRKRRSLSRPTRSCRFTRSSWGELDETKERCPLRVSWQQTCSPRRGSCGKNGMRPRSDLCRKTGTSDHPRVCQRISAKACAKEKPEWVVAKAGTSVKSRSILASVSSGAGQRQLSVSRSLRRSLRACFRCCQKSRPREGAAPIVGGEAVRSPEHAKPRGGGG